MAVTIATIAEMRTAGQEAITAEDSRLTDFAEGEPLAAVVEAMTVMADTTLRTGLENAKDTFIPTATGNALEVAIVGVGGPQRNLASAAVATIVLTRDGYVGAYNTLIAGEQITGTAPDGSEVIFALSEDLLLSAPSTTVSGEAVCTELGRDGNVPAATLVNFAGLPSGLVLTQPQVAAGGAEDELDDDYRARFQLGRVAFPGTMYGLEYGAKLVPGVTYAKAVETEITTDTGVRTLVYLYIGDPDANSNDALAADVREILDGDTDTEGWRIAGQEVLVYGAARDELAFVLTLRVKPNAGITHTMVRTAWLAYLDTLAPSEIHYRSRGETAIIDIDREMIRSADQVVPLSDKVSPTAAHKAIRSASDGSDIDVFIYEVDDAGTETLITE